MAGERNSRNEKERERQEKVRCLRRRGNKGQREKGRKAG